METKFIRIISALTARDPQVVAELNRGERARVAVEAVCFVALAALLLGLWARFLGHQIGPSGVLAALIPTVLILGLDYAMGASLEHRLARGERGAAYWLTVATRLAFALVVSGVLAVAWILTSFAPTLDANSRQVRALQMAPLLAAHEQERQALAARILGPKQAQLDALLRTREALEGQIAAVRARKQEYTQAAAEAMLAAEVELRGAMGRPRGRGPEYHVATRRAQLANAEAARAREELSVMNARLAELERQLEAAREQHAEAQTQWQEAAQALDKRLREDPRYVPEVTADALGRLRALLRIASDEAEGPVIVLVTLATFLLLVAIECAYLLSKLNVRGMSYGPRALLRQRVDDETYARGVAAELAALESDYLMRQAAGRAASDRAPLPTASAAQPNR
jgi:hypothetical protein